MTDLDPAELVDNDEPDFAALYEPHVDGDGWQMTPRMAWHLWSAALYLADEWRHGDVESQLEALPPIARPYARDRAWRIQFIAGFDRIAERLANGGEEDVLARCTAEELALHKIIDLAEAHLIDDIVSPAAVCHLPDHGEQDEDFGWMREVLFEDHDVLMLYNPSLDGIEIDATATRRSIPATGWCPSVRRRPTSSSSPTVTPRRADGRPLSE